jgi:hypothetical protein
MNEPAPADNSAISGAAGTASADADHGKPITDVAQPGTSAPSDNARSSVINHSRVKDPMMVTAPDAGSESGLDSDSKAADAAERSHFKASSKRITLQPLSAPLPVPDAEAKPKSDPETAGTTESLAEPPKPLTTAKPATTVVTSTVKMPEADMSAAALATDSPGGVDSPSPGGSAPRPGGSAKSSAGGFAQQIGKGAKQLGQTDEEAEAAAQAEHQAGIQKLVYSKQYFLPIVTVEERKNKRFIVIGIVLSLLLAISWLDVALDGGLISNTTIPHTHFFALKTKPAASATASAASTPATASKTSCGTVTVTDATFSKSPYTGCFDTKFASCSPAQITVDNESTIFGKGTITQYNIQSKVATGCNVQWQYVALPSNLAWNGKTVTCTYDNTKDFNTAFTAKTDFTGCTGPLIQLMQAQNTSSDSSNSSNSASTSGSTTSTSGGTTCTNASGTTTFTGDTDGTTLSC